MVLFQQMVIMFLFIVTGFFCGKKNIISESVSKSFSWIILNLANPALILNAAIQNCTTVKLSSLGYVFVLSLILYLSLIILGEIIPRLMKIQKADRGIFRLMIVFSNIAFMGFPILNTTFGSKAVLYASVFQFPFNLLIYTYGIKVMDSENGEFRISKMLNSGIIACSLSLLIYLVKFRCPFILSQSLIYMGNMAMPLSMLVIGTSLLSFNMRNLFMDPILLVFSFLKLIVIPSAVLLLAKHILDDSLIFGVLLVMISTPVASMCPLMAQQYGGNHSLASKGVAVTTLLSVLTMPLINWIFTSLL